MGNEKKQTAVEWLIEQYYKASSNDFLSLLNQAKQMEREQINSDFFNGYEYCRNREIDEQRDDIDINYYEKTYGTTN